MVNLNQYRGPRIDVVASSTLKLVTGLYQWIFTLVATTKLYSLGSACEEVLYQIAECGTQFQSVSSQVRLYWILSKNQQNAPWCRFSSCQAVCVLSLSLSHSLPWFWVIVGDGTSRVCCSILLNIMFYMTRLSGWVEGFKYHTLSAFALTTLITFILQCQRLCVGNINLSFSHSLPSLPSLLLLIYFQPQASNQSLLG